ncbi:hypothetical protein [Streptomyces sp. NPDC087539]|uniref:hypothetical protein n=1 Tax=Streptomyces sp. NPDC087539 TaxID=3365798 RepID=UPI00382CB767
MRRLRGGGDRGDRGGNPVVDSGKYTKQAGPVTVHALNRCVRASARISGKSGSTGWILC